MTHTFPMFNLSNLKRTLCATFEKPAAEVISQDDTACTERAFLRELMSRNPEAFQSDLGIMAMMSLFPMHF